MTIINLVLSFFYLTKYKITEYIIYRQPHILTAFLGLTIEHSLHRRVVCLLLVKTDLFKGNGIMEKCKVFLV